MASVSRTRAEHESRLGEEKKRAERGKNLIVLMLQHLTNAGYTGTVEALTAESGVSLAQYEVADNIELISALQEWEDYYELRFSRRPKLVKKLSNFSERVDPHGPGGALAGGQQLDAATMQATFSESAPVATRSLYGQSFEVPKSEKDIGDEFRRIVQGARERGRL